MKHKNEKSPLHLFQSRLDQILNMEHAMVKLAKAIDWSVFDDEFSPLYSDDLGRPGKPIRLMVGLHYLKHAFDESDESVVERLLENPYWQYLCGFEYFQHDLPLDPTSLVRFRKRVGAEGLEAMLKETVDTARRGKLLKRSDCKRVNVDTTAQEKAIAFPTDPVLYQEMRIKLVQAARVRGIKLRQSYVRKGKEALLKHNRYRAANQHRGIKHDYVGDARVHISGCGPRKKSRRDKLWRRRRSAVEPVIGHAKHDNRMNRNYLKGSEGDKMNAVLAACGYNLRKLYKAFLWPQILAVIKRLYRLFALPVHFRNQEAPMIPI